MTDHKALTWRKSSYSEGQNNCVEVAWRKSSYSQGQDNCVETSVGADGVYVRDSKLGDASPVLAYTPGEWRAFLAGARDGEFDL